MAGEAAYTAQWSVSDSSSFSGSSVRWDFTGDTVQKSTPILASQGLLGSRSQMVTRTRYGPHTVGGTLNINPSPKFLGWALIKALGGGTETAPAMANSVPEFWLLADRGSAQFGDCYKFNSMKVNRLTLSGRSGGLIDCALDVVGKTESTGQTFAGAALGSTLAYEPYQHADTSIIINADSTPISLGVLDFNLVIDNALNVRFTNSLSATQLIEGLRRITLNATVVLDGTDIGDLYAAIITSYKNGESGSLQFTNSTVASGFTFAKVQIPNRTPVVNGDEFIFTLAAEIRGTTGAEFTCVNDVTP